MTESATVTITNKRGLHARASAKFVKLAAQFNAAIEVTKNGTKVIATSIMGLLLLSASKGDCITISAKGPEAKGAVNALVQLVKNRFDEKH